ncbi:hypothetical protein TNCV_2893961 [Trichonephila clavipes]|nr:hypothetical protein TNCV_2893961 [Trichonephila clavipes]
MGQLAEFQLIMMKHSITEDVEGSRSCVWLQLMTMMWRLQKLWTFLASDWQKIMVLDIAKVDKRYVMLGSV